MGILRAMQSMTGFGRGAAATEKWQATVELSSVNRKQAEIVIAAPRELNELDARIRKAVLAVVSRGRVQVTIHLELPQGVAADCFQIDRALARGLADAFGEITEIVGYPVVPVAADFLRQPGIVTMGNTGLDAETAWPAIEPALADALSQLAAMREREGRDLYADLLVRLDLLNSHVRSIAKNAPARPPRQRELLTKRLRDAGLEFDLADERVVREIALFADRCDVTEEITRLDSHFTKFREYLAADQPPGRALDFLCQEISREFNTIGSKAYDAHIAQTVVEAKTDLEKIREQAQNVE